MSQRSGSRLAWSCFTAVTLLFLTGVVLEIVNPPAPHHSEWDSGSVGDYLFVALTYAFPLIGVFVAARAPRNAIGWIMLGIGLANGLTLVIDGYAWYGLEADPGSLPRPDLALAITSGAWVIIIVPILTFLLLLFPDGHLPSRRWRPVAYLAAVAMIGTYTVFTVFPGGFAESGYPDIRNPLGIEALKPWSDALLSFLFLVPVAVLACAASVVVRFRAAQGQRRLQMKWLATAAAIVGVLYGLTIAASLVSGLTGRASPPPWILGLQTFAPISFVLIPVAIGVAILRHRLYDIDAIINKTIVYGAATMTLLVTYLVGVTAFQTLFRPVAGDSDLAVAASTLAVAALFRPALRAIQSFIDKRFYRRRYDAVKELEGFSGRLRDEIDLTSLTATMLGVVSRTVQPAHVSVWLREAPAERSVDVP